MRAAVGLLVSAICLLLPMAGVYAQDSRAAVFTRSEPLIICLQGTWRAEREGQALSGTWQMRFLSGSKGHPSLALREKKMTNFSSEIDFGTSALGKREVYGSVGADRIEFSAPSDRERKGLAAEAISGEGALLGDTVEGTFTLESGVKGQWSGWWVTKSDSSEESGPSGGTSREYD